MQNVNSYRNNKKLITGVLTLLAVAVFFIGSAYLGNQYEQELRLLVDSNGLLGMSVYVLITTLAIVIAPVSTLPLIPIAVTMWGWQITGILSIIGWVIGSQIAFSLARNYGKNLIKKFVSLEKIERLEQRISQENIFWTVVLLRMTLPVDVLSYALGLFSNMQAKAFFLATLLGVTPFAFIFSYLGSLPLTFQLVTLSLTIFISTVYYRQRKSHH